MASAFRGETAIARVDTSYLRSLSASVRTAVTALEAAVTNASKANRHENWQCAEKHNVTIEINHIISRARRMAIVLNDTANILGAAAGKFENGQNLTISNMNRPQLRL